LIKWAEHEGVRLNPDAVTFGAVADRFEADHLPTVAPKTQKDYRRQLGNLKAVFGESALDSIKPMAIDRRTALACAAIRAGIAPEGEA
jgi:hypothetical protein